MLRVPSPIGSLLLRTAKSTLPRYGTRSVPTTMNSRSLCTIAIFGFVILGTICLELRREAIRRDEAAREDTYWEIAYDAHFQALRGNNQSESQLRLAVPFDTRHCTVDRQREAARIDGANL